MPRGFVSFLLNVRNWAVCSITIQRYFISAFLKRVAFKSNWKIANIQMYECQDNATFDNIVQQPNFFLSQKTHTQ